jgi:hypothetical protein
VEPGIRGGLVASPARSPGKLATSAGLDDDSSADGVSIRRRAFEQKGQGAAPFGLIAKVNQGLVI